MYAQTPEPAFRANKNTRNLRMGSWYFLRYKKIVSYKISPPFKEAEIDIMYGTGISKEGDILDLATNINIVNKSNYYRSIVFV